MKTIILIISILFLSSVCFFSCTFESNNCGDPVPYYARIILVDSLNHTLIGNLYKPDSIRFKADTTTITTYFNEGSMVFNMNGLQNYNNKFYFLYLENTDTDTLSMKVRLISTECYNYYLIDSLYYNQVLTSPTYLNTFIVLKNI